MIDEPTEVRLKKKKQFPGLCIPDDQQRAQTLLYDKEDEKIATEALSEASGYNDWDHSPCTKYM